MEKLIFSPSSVVQIELHNRHGYLSAIDYPALVVSVYIMLSFHGYLSGIVSIWSPSPPLPSPPLPSPPLSPSLT